MHLFHAIVIFIVMLVVGIELSVSAFVNPSAWHLDPEAQFEMLSRFAAILGKVMPVCYPVVLLLLGAETWFHRNAQSFGILLAASAVWFLASLASILFLVPLNNRVIQGGAGWQEMHPTWDKRHRVRIAALALAGFLLIYALLS